MHGTADARVPIAHAEHAHTAITGFELLRIDSRGHTAFLFRPDLQQKAVWLQDRDNR